MRLLAQNFNWLSPHNDISSVPTAEANALARKPSRRRLVLLCLMIFALAFTVRFFQWQDHNRLAVATHMSMNQYYLNDAKPLIKGNVYEFVRGTDPARDASVVAHPPGYGLLIAIAALTNGNPNLPLQLFQIFCDSLCAVLIFLIAAELLPVAPALLAGVVLAFSPQLGFYSMLLLPDALITLPILLAVLLIIRAMKQRGPWKMAAAGALIGVSCWLRPNGLLLAPFLAVALFFCFKRERRLRYALMLIAGMLVVISPITIRNYMVFHSFIPLSAGTGSTLIVGIAEYDEENRFGLPKSDIEVMRQEAQMHNRPEYALTLYNPDGIERERERVARGLAVIRSHPLWFLKVALKRIKFMLELSDREMPEYKVRPYAPLKVPVNYDKDAPHWSASPAELVSQSIIAKKTEVQVTEDGQRLRVTGDYFPFWTDHIVSQSIRVEPQTVYVVRVPVKLDGGRAILSVMSADLETEFASVFTPDPVEVRDTTNQPLREVELAFTSGTNTEACIVLRDGAMGYQNLTAEIGRVQMYAAGPAQTDASHYPRLLVRAVQQLLMAAWPLPFVALGILLLLLAGRLRVALVLLAIPAYYLCLQSMLHVEPRYILPVHYFFAILASVPFYWLAQVLRKSCTRRRAVVESTLPATHENHRNAETIPQAG